MIDKSNSDHDFFKRIAQNDEQAFAVFFDRYHTRFIRYAALFTLSIHEAEDVVSEVLIKLLKRRGEVFLKENVIGYIFQCIKNQGLDHLRKEKKRQSAFDFNYDDKDYFVFEKETPFTELAQAELTSIIRNRIEQLPPKRRQVFKLVKDENMSHKEVASLMDISDRTVEVHLKLALNEIKETITTYLNHSGYENNNNTSSSQ